MNRSFTLAPIGIFLLFASGCASEDPFTDDSFEGEPVDAIEEGLLGDADPDDAIGQDPPQDDVLPAYCNGVTNWNATWTAFENDVLTLVNQKRAAGAICGGVSYGPAPALTFHANLRCSARVHSKDMGDKNFFSHAGSNGSSFAQRITSAGYTWTAAAENIGAGYSTPAATVNGWMSSPGHCKNIMNKSYVHLGTGYYYAGTSTYKHYWTQNFAKP
jgi:uncharacterized protein YkwD